MTTFQRELIFSNLASSKFEKLSKKDQENAIDLLLAFKAPNNKDDVGNHYIKLNDNLYALKINKLTRLIISEQDHNLLITDLISFNRESNLYTPDKETIEYIDELDSEHSDIEFVFDNLKVESKKFSEKIISLEQDILNKRLKAYELSNFRFHTLIFTMGIIFSLFGLVNLSHEFLMKVIFIASSLMLLFRIISMYNFMNIKNKK